MSGPRTVVFKVTYARTSELRADVDQQLLRGGLLIKVTDLSGLTLDLPVRLELVLPDGSALHGDASVLQVLPGFGVAVSAGAELVDQLTRVAHRLASHRDAPGAEPARHERHEIDAGRPARTTTAPPPARPGGTTRPQVARAHSPPPMPTAPPQDVPRPTPTPFPRPAHVTPSSEIARPTPAPFARPAHVMPPTDAPRPTPSPFARPAHVMPSPDASRPTPAPFARPAHVMPSPDASRPTPAPFARPAHVMPSPDASRPPPAPFARPAHVMPSPDASRPTPAPFARPAHVVPSPDASRPTPAPFARPALTTPAPPPPARGTRPTSPLARPPHTTPPPPAGATEPGPPPASPVASPGAAGARTQPPAAAPAKPDGPTRAEKIQLALHGSRDERNAILRDRDRTLHPFVLKNPQLDADDALAIAKNAQLNPDVLKMLGERKDWVQRPTIALALARNPKTPPELAVRVLDYLSIEALRQLAKGVGVLPHVTQAARKKLLG